jgi:hypothetical protein
MQADSYPLETIVGNGCGMSRLPPSRALRTEVNDAGPGFPARLELRRELANHIPLTSVGGSAHELHDSKLDWIGGRVAGWARVLAHPGADGWAPVHVYALPRVGSARNLLPVHAPVA